MSDRLSASKPSPFAVDREAEVPVGVQLSWRLRALIASGRIGAAERLPSVRDLAGWAGVNLNTVRAVYADLEEDGLLRSRQGQGTFVADGIEPEPELERIALEAIRRAGQAGLDLRNLAIVTSVCAGMPGALDGSERAPDAEALPDLSEESEALEVRQELRRQIARLEAELASYVRDLPSGLATAPRRASAHIAGVEELEETRDTLIAKLSEAQKAAETRAREEGRRRRQRLAQASPVGRAPAESPLERAMSWWRRKL
jgi:GntR family transcriptional regulator